MPREDRPRKSTAGITASGVQCVDQASLRDGATALAGGLQMGMLVIYY